MNRHMNKIVIVLLAAMILAGCARLPYDRTTESSVAGAAAGATAGAVLAGDDDQLLGAALGGLVGAAAGYVIGAKTSWFGHGDTKEFDQTLDEAQSDPATVDDVYGSSDADLNDDGLVTRDELIALSNAGVPADEIIDRLEATNQVFYVSETQRQSLLEAGVDPEVVYDLEDINRG